VCVFSAHNLAKSNLYHGLHNRRTLNQMKESGLYRDAETSDRKADPSEGDDSEGGGADNGPLKASASTRAPARLAAAHPSGEAKEYPAPQKGYERRSKNFHLTRILLKFVNNWGVSGELSLAQKGALKDLIVDQDPVILTAAEAFDAENDLEDFKQSLLKLTVRPRD